MRVTVLHCGSFGPEALARLAGQTVPFKDTNGARIGTAALRADGTADVTLNAAGLRALLVDGEVFGRVPPFDLAEPQADAPHVAEGRPDA